MGFCTVCAKKNVGARTVYPSYTCQDCNRWTCFICKEPLKKTDSFTYQLDCDCVIRFPELAGYRMSIG